MGLVEAVHVSEASVANGERVETCRNTWFIMYSFVLCIAQGHYCLQAATLLLNRLIQRGRVLLSCVGPLWVSPWVAPSQLKMIRRLGGFESEHDNDERLSCPAVAVGPHYAHRRQMNETDTPGENTKTSPGITS